MLESTEARSRLFAAMSRYLASKSGPIHPSRIPERLLGVEYCDLGEADKRVIIGTLARLGFEQCPGDWPHFYRRDPETEAAA